MKWTAKNIFILVIVGLMILITIIPVFAESKPPFTDESYYLNLCTGSSYEDNQETCDDFRAYYKDKIDKDSENLKETKYELSEVRKNVKHYEKLFEDTLVQEENLKKQVQQIQNGIDATEKYIAQLEVQIIAQEKDIEDTELQVMEYIATSQKQSYTNSFIEFIMGAKDFSELVSRMEGMKRIKEYNDDLIDQLIIKKAEMEADKQLAHDSVEAMRQDKDALVVKQSELEIKAREAQSLYRNFESMLDELVEKEQKLQKAIDYSEEQLKNIRDVSTSNGWFHGLGYDKSKYRLTNHSFSYDDGSFHPGTDYGTQGRRNPLYAPGNGFVAMSENLGCSDNGRGGTPPSCGAQWGNYITMVVSVDNKIYGVSYAHLTQGSIRVTQGQTIKAGQQVGLVGATGLSVGTHLHVEIYDLPYSSLDQAANALIGTKDRNFGAGRGSGGSRICSRGASAPCRVDAAVLWGDR